MIEVLIIFALLIIISRFSEEAQKAEAKKLDGLQKTVIKDIAKVCPPHKWFYQEIKDLEGKTCSWRVVCELCGPMKPLGDK